jgi:hypothetical protein
VLSRLNERVKELNKFREEKRKKGEPLWEDIKSDELFSRYKKLKTV